MSSGDARAVLARSWWAGCLALATACGGDGAEPSTGSGGAGGAGVGGGSGSGGSTSAAGGSSGAGGVSGGGTSGSGNAGSGGNGTVGCNGTFGTPRVLLSASPGDELHSATVSSDELELFYAYITPNVPDGVHFHRSTRGSTAEVFSPGTIVPELDAACEPGQRRTMDLSHDGLRAYLVCVPPDGPMISGSLRIAERASLDAPFVLRPMTYGEIGNSPSLSADELTLYTSKPDGSYEYIQRYERGSTSEAFGPGENLVLGDMSYPSSPDIGPDELTLFVGANGTVGAATRPSPDAAFGAVSEVVPIPPPDGAGAPEISRDCRSLYFINVGSMSGLAAYSIRVVTR